ncbi:hypothetical protein SAMN02745975_03901 [Geosporobacter subterraneus DSM 17957]|uniref:Uncharacterized protein n=1 Tax=Geosporobacter subterraneus DSM 17957 TaxID=1121919 RepID=A0A1M6QQ69_9FIRM|nr:hypothetical protein [Geosporobacter subterraneus]SHK22429.1 hypothetical protein SAMN02745975_03901 [Geosporobacter subterraneus DSM 17957]
MKKEHVQEKKEISYKKDLGKKEYKTMSNHFDAYTKAYTIMDQNRQERINSYKKD